MLAKLLELFEHIAKGDLPEFTKIISQKWKGLSANEKDEWNAKAKSLNDTKNENLSETQKSALVMKKVNQAKKLLEVFHCHFIFIFIIN